MVRGALASLLALVLPAWSVAWTAFPTAGPPIDPVPTADAPADDRPVDADAEGADDTVTAARAFSLELNWQADRPQEFSIGLGPGDSPHPGIDLVRGASRFGAAPAIVGLPHWSLGVGMNIGLDDGGRPRILLLGPLEKSWDDLDGWEKLGVVLHTAAGAAAIGHFAGKLVDKVK